MNKDFFEALSILGENVDKTLLIKRVKSATFRVIKKNYPNAKKVVVNIDEKKEVLKMGIVKTVVLYSHLKDPDNEICFEEAKKILPKAKLGEEIFVPLNHLGFRRTTVGILREALRKYRSA